MFFFTKQVPSTFIYKLPNTSLNIIPYKSFIFVNIFHKIGNIFLRLFQINCILLGILKTILQIVLIFLQKEFQVFVNDST